MTEEPVDDPFHDCELDPAAFLGIQIFEDVLFTDDTETLTRRVTSRPHTRTLRVLGTQVNMLTGETPAHSQATVEELKEFAANIAPDTPQIALPASAETQIETQSKPYTAAAFFHFNATG